MRSAFKSHFRFVGAAHHNRSARQRLYVQAQKRRRGGQVARGRPPFRAATRRAAFEEPQASSLTSTNSKGIPQSIHRPPRWEVDTRCAYAITSICEKSRHGRSKLPDRDHPGVSGPCPHPHTAAHQPCGCGFVISFILRTILRARAELAPSPTPRLRRVVTRLHRGPRRWFLAVRSCRSPRRFDRAISRFI